MLCEICRKNEATIHIQELINKQKKTIHICPGCAAEKDKGPILIDGMNLAEILYKISNQIGDVHPGAENKPAPAPNIRIVKCKTCGWDSSKLVSTGRLGCAECYKTFSEILSGALKNMHKGTMHVGKKPGDGETGRQNSVLEILELQKKLQEYVQREEYEKAAGIRDKINLLKETPK